MLELKVDDITHKYLNHYGTVFNRLRDDATGNYAIRKQVLTNKKIQILKHMYGPNGDTTNISTSLLLRFPDAQKHNLKSSLKGELSSVFKSYDNTSVLSTYKVDTSQRQDGLNIYLIVSWTKDDIDAETKSIKLINGLSTILTSMSSFLTAPFNNVELNPTLQPITIEGHVSSTIHSIVSTYNIGTNDTDVVVKTVGLYDHIGIKINDENDNEYKRLKKIGENSINISGINPLNDVIIATLFDGDYKKLYTAIQSPQSFIQQTQGKNGDLYNVAVDGSITLDLNENDFITNNQEDFISTMNSATGGYTVIINVFAGSAIVEYQVIFSVTKLSSEINDVVTNLNDDVEIQNIINTSTTMVGVTCSKTANTTAVQNDQVLIKKPGIIKVGFNGDMVIDTVGSYHEIHYKVTGHTEFLTTTSKTISLPIAGFVDQLDVKLVDVSGSDLTTVTTYTVDMVAPVITLIGNAKILLGVGDAYVEQGATVTDNSGEIITPVITGSVDVDTVGVYTVTYTATDSAGNKSIVTRTVSVSDKIVSQYVDYGIFATPKNYLLTTNYSAFSVIKNGRQPPQLAPQTAPQQPPQSLVYSIPSQAPQSIEVLDLTNYGDIYAWGGTNSGGSLSDGAVQIINGNFAAVKSNPHSFTGIKNDGSVFTYGRATHGGGLHPTDNGYVNVFTSGYGYCGIKADGSLTAWGGSNNAYATNCPTDSGYTHVYANLYGFVAIKADGTTTTWHGGVADGIANAPASNVVFKAIYSTTYTFIGMKLDGSLVTWGYAPDIPTPTDTDFVDILGRGHIFIGIKADGSVKSWGTRDPASGAPVDSGYTKFAINNDAAAALKSDGSITAWGIAGYGGSGAPADAGYTNIYSGTGVFVAIKADGSLTAWGMSAHNINIAPSGTGWTNVYSAEAMAMSAIKADGSIVTWGDPLFGGGSAPTDTGYTQIYSQSNGFAAIKADGSITSWGYTTEYVHLAPTGTGYNFQ